MPQNTIDEIARRRGFFWQASEIYGGLSGFFEYAHLGTLIKRRWEDSWRKYFVGMDDNFFEIETSTVMHEKVFVASGHLENFVDPIVKCKKCGNFERADQLVEGVLKENFEGKSVKELNEIIKTQNIRCPKCKGPLEDVGILNMMFPVTIGGDIKAYLRPESAQGPYINFKREFETLRKRLPIGLAVIGKVYRNEISPRQSLLRMREFTQAELQIFFDPLTINEHPDFDRVKDYKLRLFSVDNRRSNKIIEIPCKDVPKQLNLPKYYIYYMAKIQQFYIDVIKIPRELFRFRELSSDERAFYNKFHWDVEIFIEEIGFKEVGGIHYRTNHDLSGHAKVSNNDMSVFFDGRKFVPHVLELSFGVDRNIFALMNIFYEEQKDRSVFHFPRMLAPYHCAIFPLLNKDGMPEKSIEIKDALKSLNIDVFYDVSGSIGRRYRRMDEIGVPACITVDHESLSENTVTLRDRDSTKQVRVKIKELSSIIQKFINGEDISNLGVPVEKKPDLDK